MRDGGDIIECHSIVKVICGIFRRGVESMYEIFVYRRDIYGGASNLQQEILIYDKADIFW